MPRALRALSVGAFGIGLTEFVILGLLPQVAGDLHVGDTAAGWLISGYALSVAAGAMLLTAAVNGRDRRQVLLGLMVLFVAGNAVSALAPDYVPMLAGRVLAALCHGAFFGIGAVLAGDLAGDGRRARAVASMFAGLTIANVVGVPLGTLIGQQLGWRATFWTVAAIGVVALVLLARLVPRDAEGAAAGPSLRSELGALRDRQVWLSLVVTILGWGGLFGAFTYIAYTLTRVSGFPDHDVPWLLVVFGAGLVIGNAAGGRLADRALGRTLTISLTLLCAVLAGFGLTAASRPLAVLALLLMGAAGFAAAPGLQMRVLRHAAHAPALASAANIGAFNVGNAIGAWVGGLGIAAGLGYRSPIWSGAAMTLAGLLVLVAAERSLVPRAAPPAPGGAPAPGA